MTSRMTPIKQFPMKFLNQGQAGPRILMAGLFFLASYFLGFLIRYRFSLPKEVVSSFWITVPIIVSMKVASILLLKQWTTRAASWLRHLDAEIAGVSIAAALFIVISHLVFPHFHIAIAKSVILIDWGLCLGFLCVSRILMAKAPVATDPPKWGQAVSYSLGLLFLCIGLLYGSLGYQEQLNIDWFNGDALFPAHLVEDVVVGGNSVSGWLFPPAPFVFPDIIFALVTRGVTDQPAVGMFLTGALLYLLIWISVYSGIAMTTPYRRTALLLTTLSASGIIVLLALATTGTHLKYLFFPAYHTGTYAFAILLSVGGVYLATTEESRWLSIAAFAVLGFCSGFSDLLTVAYVSAPLTAALAMGWLMNFIAVRRAALMSALVWSAPLLGVSCARATLRMEDFNRFSQRSNASVAKGTERMLFGLITELSQLSPLFLCAALWLLACGVWFLLSLYKISRNTWDAQALPVAFKRRLVLLLTLALSGLSTMAALAVGGNYSLLEAAFEHSVRYLHPVIFTPLLFWPLLVPESVFDRMARAFPKPVLVQIGILSLIIPLGAILYLGKGPHRLHRYAPGYVAHLDRIAKERGLTQGVAYYWTARDVNLYSQSDLRVFSVTPDLTYFDWMNNLNWVAGPFDEQHVAPRPEFVILSPREVYSRETAVERFGEPVEEIPLNNSVAGYVALIYDRESHDKLARQLVKPTLAWGNGFYDPERSGADEWRWCESQGVLEVKNISNETQPVRVEFECVIASAPTGALVMQSSFFSGRFAMENHRKHISQILQVPPGQHRIVFSSDAPALKAPNDNRTLVFQVRNLKASVVPETEL